MNLHFFGIDLELNSAYFKINLIFLLCAEPYSRPLEKCFVTPGMFHLWCGGETNPFATYTQYFIRDFKNDRTAELMNF